MNDGAAVWFGGHIVPVEARDWCAWWRALRRRLDQERDSCTAASGDKRLEHEAGELIEGVSELQAHENQGRDDKISAEMHEALKPKISS